MAMPAQAELFRDLTYLIPKCGHSLSNTKQEYFFEKGSTIKLKPIKTVQPRKAEKTSHTLLEALTNHFKNNTNLVLTVHEILRKIKNLMAFLQYQNQEYRIYHTKVTRHLLSTLAYERKSNGKYFQLSF